MAVQVDFVSHADKMPDEAALAQAGVAEVSHLAGREKSTNFDGMTHGFKEWALICEALGSGKQSIILRKGGIAEGRAGFRFEHEDFLLFPTLFHEQAAKMKIAAHTALPAAREDGQVEIRYRAHVEWTEDLIDIGVIRSLAPHHLWQDSEIEKRFVYEEKRSVSLALLRIFRLSEPFVFPDSPKYGGCRSWVSLPAVPEGIQSTPVIEDALHRERAEAVQALIGRNHFASSAAGSSADV